MASEMLRVEGPAEAVRVATELCHQVVRCPIAGVLPDRSGKGWYVAATAGLGSAGTAELRRSAALINVRARRLPALQELAGRFVDITGRGPIDVVGAGDAALFLAGTGAAPTWRVFVSGMASMLSSALAHVAVLSWARVRMSELDLGIAWTAHEIVDPLHAARSALDQVLRDGNMPGTPALLRRTREELDQLAAMVRPLLEWSTGSTTLRRRRVDLTRVVREVVGSVELSTHDDRIVVATTPDLSVMGDLQQLRGAMANLIRNALAYSPPGSAVNVTVRRTVRQTARISVRDRGPGIPPRERHLIFDPFARGSLGQGTRAGRGLGLFIARRVAEAHGGSLTLRSGTSGSTFCMELPVVDARRSRSTP
ncbi:MAG: sensor histidine kinase [Candidatus Velamenicoccus archaeovorus]